MIDKLNINDIDSITNLFTNFNKERIIYSINNNSFSNYYIYKMNNKIVGIINFDIMYERAELIDINVLKEYENNKIGSKLLQKMFDECKIKNVKSITLEVKINNYNAIHLYKKYGFKEVSKRLKYYNGVDALLMEKELI